MKRKGGRKGKGRGDRAKGRERKEKGLNPSVDTSQSLRIRARVLNNIRNETFFQLESRPIASVQYYRHLSNWDDKAIIPECTLIVHNKQRLIVGIDVSISIFWRFWSTRIDASQPPDQKSWHRHVLLLIATRLELLNLI